MLEATILRLLSESVRVLQTGVWLVFLLFLLGCRDDAPERQLAAWRQIESSESLGARDEAPALLDSARTSYDIALQLIERENERWFLLRDYASADSHLTLADSLATRAASTASENRRLKYAGLQRRIGRLTARLENIREEASRHLMRMSLRRGMASAELQIAAAARIVSESTLAETQVALESAEDALATVEHALSNPPTANGAEAERWRQWVDETMKWSRRTDSSALIVVKRRHRAYLINRGHVGSSFTVELGFGSAENKRFAGDAATPEGIYRVTKHRETGSRYYKALNLDYPNREDKLRFESARKAGTIPLGVRIGGNIEIHGHGGRGADWTNGCIALTNEDIDRLMDELGTGSRVTIVRYIDEWPE